MFQYRLMIKVLLICLAVNVVVYLPYYLLLVFSSNYNILVVVGDWQYIIQYIMMCFCGVWLCQHQLKQETVVPALYDKTILQFISQYGLIVLLSVLVVYAGDKLNWCFPNWTGMWSQEQNRYIWFEDKSWWYYFAGHCLTFESLKSYWLMYIAYGWTKSRQRVQIKHMQNIGK